MQWSKVGGWWWAISFVVKWSSTHQNHHQGVPDLLLCHVKIQQGLSKPLFPLAKTLRLFIVALFTWWRNLLVRSLNSTFINMQFVLSQSTKLTIYLIIKWPMLMFEIALIFTSNFIVCNCKSWIFLSNICNDEILIVII